MTEYTEENGGSGRQKAGCLLRVDPHSEGGKEMEAESLDAVVSAQCLELKPGTDFSTGHGSEQISSFAPPVPTQRNDWHRPGRKLEGWETPF